jgi:hypothetical protein
MQHKEMYCVDKSKTINFVQANGISFTRKTDNALNREGTPSSWKNEEQE